MKRLMILITMTLIATAVHAATVVLSTARCNVSSGQSIGECGTTAKRKNFGKKAAAIKLGCWPGDGIECTSSQQNDYRMEIEMSDIEDCGIIYHETWRGTPASTPTHDDHILLWTDVSVTPWQCSHSAFQHCVGVY